MKQLITSTEVMEIVFGTTHTLDPSELPDHTILAAQQRLLKPILGEALFERLAAESPTAEIEALTTDYIKTPLALYVASLVLPTIAAKVGSAGVVRLSSERFEAAEGTLMRRLCRRLRADADALMDVAIDYLKAHHDLFPDFLPDEDIRRRVSLVGGVVI